MQVEKTVAGLTEEMNEIISHALLVRAYVHTLGSHCGLCIRCMQPGCLAMWHIPGAVVRMYAVISECKSDFFSR